LNFYIITVEFRLLPGCREAFLPLIRENARRFDVLVPHSNDSGTDECVLLYEIYNDENAFEAHCRTPHFFEFDRASRSLYEAKIIQRYTLIQGTEAEPVS
jgi:(4S)-4-hydroxy-5-phosphonooxypentane-2,3-dione isomerase